MHADLGEVLFWWGTFLMGISASTTIIPWWTIAGTAFISMMIYFISIPMMEERQLERRPDAYRRYMHAVPSKLVLWFRRPDETVPLVSRAAAVSGPSGARELRFTSLPTTV